MPGRDYQGKPNPGHGTPFDWVKPHKPVPDWLRSLPPIPFEVPRWDKERSEGGACPIADISDKPGRWYLRVNRYGISVGLRHRSRSRVAGENTGLRRSMARSLSRLSWATHVLEHHGVRPTHMITLTLPPEAWEKRIEELGRDEAVRLFLQARARFLDALRQRLRRGGGSGSWLWFLEFQERRGAPHVHILLDLGGRLSSEEYQDWVKWVEAEWSRALGVPTPYATRVEFLRKGDFRYARKYAAKPKQKSFPFPARWGRSWGVAGYWRELLRESRHTPTSTYEFSTEEVYWALVDVYESLAYQVPILRVYLTIRALVEGVRIRGLSYYGRLPLSGPALDLALAVITLGRPIPITELLGWDTS